MRKIAIQDANILIDLVKLGLFRHCLSLDFQFCTTDIIFVELKEEQMALIQVHIDAEEFSLIKISDEELLEIQIASLEDTRLSEQDWSAIYFAEKEKAILLSGDKKLNKISAKRKIKVHGILWLFDQLVESNILTQPQACEFLRTLIATNKRLPTEECKKRIDQWSGVK